MGSPKVLLPTLMTLIARSEFGCSTFKHDEDEVVVVSGGRGAENKAEILFISTGDWMPRKYLLSLGRLNF